MAKAAPDGYTLLSSDNGIMTMNKKEQRLRRARQTRARIATQGSARLTVFRSNTHIYASVISGCGTKVLASASTVEKEVS